MNKPKIFISHIHEEADYVNKIKKWLDEMLLGAVELFVSTDKGKSIPLGSEWPNRIKESLKDSQILLVIISHFSKQRRWIYFESGAAYVRGIPVIPICIGGMQVNDLPSPLNLLNAIELPKRESEVELLQIVAKSAGLRPPITHKEIKLPKREIHELTNEGNMDEFNSVSNGDLKSRYDTAEVFVELVKFYQTSGLIDKKFTITQLEIKTGLKGKRKRKYLFEILENLLEIGYINKLQEKNTYWQLSKKGREVIKNIDQ